MKIEKPTILMHYDSHDEMVHVMSTNVVGVNDLYTLILSQSWVQTAELRFARDDDDDMIFDTIRITTDNGSILYFYPENLHTLNIEGYTRIGW